MTNTRRGAGIALLGLAGLSLGVLALLTIDENRPVTGLGWSLLELVAYLLVAGGVIAVLVGLVLAGLALVRRP